MEVWGYWWFRVFQVPSLHDTLLDLLIDGIHEPSFVQESALFGVRWIQHCVMQQKVIGESVDLSYRTFIETPDVKHAAKDLCVWIV